MTARRGSQALEGHSVLAIAVVFSPDGKFIASASNDSTVRLWNPSTGAALQILEGHLGTVWDVVHPNHGTPFPNALLIKQGSQLL